MNLDAIDIRAADPTDMLARIRELPLQCQQSWAAVNTMKLPAAYASVANVAVLGMGGSAIGGDLARSLVADSCRVPITVLRDYDLPAWVSKDTLVIASSYSGNTEETLSAFAQAVDRGSHLVAVTTGGRLQAAAKAAGAPVFPVTYVSQPRAALGWSLVPILGLLQAAGLAPDQSAAVAEAVGVMERLQTEIDAVAPMARNAAKQLAQRLHGKIPVVYGAGLLSEVARRWKGQFNENAKNWAFYEVLPELNHNAVLGYEFPADLAARLTVIILSAPGDHPRNRVRQTVTAELLRRAGVAVEEVSARGASPLAQVLSAIHFGDYVSYYLALLNEVDPSHVNAINYLKDVLSKS